MIRLNFLTLFACIALSFAHVSSADDFIIGGWAGPLMSGNANDKTAITSFKNEGFNAIIRTMHNLAIGRVFFTTSALTPSFPTTKPPGSISGVNWPTDLLYNITPSATNEYRLSILDQVGGVKMMVEDRQVIGYDPCESDANCQTRQEYIASAYKTYSNHRTKMLGYFIGDEPNSDNQITGYLSKVNYLANKDNNVPGYFNLAANGGRSWGSSINGLQSYQSYVQQCINNSNVKYVSFDFYVFHNSFSCDINGNPTIPINTQNENYNINTDNRGIFNCLNLFSSSIKNNGYNKNFWFIGCASEGEVWVRTDFRIAHIIKPEEKHLRYFASSALIYGAKGLLWYIYSLANCNTVFKQADLNAAWATLPPTNYEVYLNAPETDATTKGLITTLNNEVQKMGPILMTLRWQRTVHGNAIDPSTGEQFLDVIDANAKPLYSLSAGTGASSKWSKDSLAIGLFKDSNWDYLLIMNKSVYKISSGSVGANNVLPNGTWGGNANITKYTVFGKVYPRQFDKKNGGWKKLTPTYNSANNTTSFELTINPGDMQMVVLGPANITPAINLLLNN